MKKISIEICSSPNCYVKSAALFKQLESVMSARLKTETERTGTYCGGECKSCAMAPCVRIDGRLISKATPAKVLENITIG